MNPGVIPDPGWLLDLLSQSLRSHWAGGWMNDTSPFSKVCNEWRITEWRAGVTPAFIESDLKRVQIITSLKKRLKHTGAKR